MSTDDEQLRRIATHLANRLRVHASSVSAGYVHDPEPGDDDTGPGMSERWCYRDQHALEQYDHAFGRDTSHHSPACLICSRQSWEDDRYDDRRPCRYCGTYDNTCRALPRGLCCPDCSNPDHINQPPDTGFPPERR
jgi:hypothetical protein